MFCFIKFTICALVARRRRIFDPCNRGALVFHEMRIEGASLWGDSREHWTLVLMRFIGCVVERLETAFAFSDLRYHRNRQASSCILDFTKSVDQLEDDLRLMIESCFCSVLHSESIISLYQVNFNLCLRSHAADSVEVCLLNCAARLKTLSLCDVFLRHLQSVVLL